MTTDQKKYPLSVDVGFFLMISGVLILGVQIYEYLRNGSWHSLSVISLLQFFDVEWALMPSDWMGLYNMMDIVPLSLAALVAGFLIFILSID
jgi:hypothetical protein